MILFQTFETDPDTSIYYSFETEEVDGATVSTVESNLQDEAVTEKTEVSDEGNY